MPHRYLNEDHDPADFATCPSGHSTRQFDLPAGQITGRRGDWILAYVCDTCADNGAIEGAKPGDVPIIRVPHWEKLAELRIAADRASSLTH